MANTNLSLWRWRFTSYGKPTSGMVRTETGTWTRQWPGPWRFRRYV